MNRCPHDQARVNPLRWLLVTRWTPDQCPTCARRFQRCCDHEEVVMATTEDRLGRVPGISDPGLNLAGGLASLDTGLQRSEWADPMQEDGAELEAAMAEREGSLAAPRTGSDNATSCFFCEA